MFGKKSVDTIVVGAGPTGMLAALLLTQNGIDTTVIDSAERSCTSRSAILLHPRSIRLFERLGFAERVIERAYRINEMRVYDDKQPRDTVRFDELPIAYPYALSIPQSDLEFILEDELNRAGVEVMWNYRLSEFKRDENGLNLEVDRYSDRGMGYAISHTERIVDKTFHYHANFMIAADGYNSLVQRLARVDQSVLGDDQYFIFFEFETDMDPEHAIRLSIQDDLATAQFPMVGGFARLAFQFMGVTLPSENRNKDREPVQDRHNLPEFLDDRHFKELLETRVPWITGYINQIRYRAAVPFEKRYLKTPYVDRIFFLGDSARQFGPLGCLSLNLGLHEADLIASKYAQVRGSGREMNFRLEELADAMVAQWLFLADLQNRSTPIDMSDQWVAQNRGRILRSLPASGEALERLAGQLFLHLKHDQLVEV